MLYKGACNPTTAAEIVRPTSDVRPTERVDHWTDGKLWVDQQWGMCDNMGNQVIHDI